MSKPIQNRPDFAPQFHPVLSNMRGVIWLQTIEEIRYTILPITTVCALSRVAGISAAIV